MSWIQQSSTFVCAFCEFEDRPQLLKAPLIDEHAIEIAGQHWGHAHPASAYSGG